MPRCETCHAERASAEVRKMPGRDAHRCKDKFACELARTNRDPYTVTLEITFPAKSHREAWDIIRDLRIDPFPVTPLHVTGADGTVTRSREESRYTHDDLRDAIATYIDTGAER